MGVDALTHIGVCDGYGSPAASPYKLPWTTGERREVSQGNCSAISHFGNQRYSYDIDMAINTNVLAARGGTVVELKENEADGNGCPNANYVLIRHSDNTVAAYFHMTQNGVLVSVGATVNQSDVIAKSGNTGCTSGPHLHFMVYTDSTYSETAPVVFSNALGAIRGLVMGEYYTP